MCNGEKCIFRSENRFNVIRADKKLENFQTDIFTSPRSECNNNKRIIVQLNLLTNSMIARYCASSWLSARVESWHGKVWSIYSWTAGRVEEFQAFIATHHWWLNRLSRCAPCSWLSTSTPAQWRIIEIQQSPPFDRKIPSAAARRTDPTDSSWYRVGWW